MNPWFSGPVLASEIDPGIAFGKGMLGGFGKLAFKASPRYNNVFALRYKHTGMRAPDQLREGLCR